MYTNVIITVALIGVALYFGAKLVTYYLNLPQKMEIEIRWKNALINDLLQLSKTDKVAKDLVTRFNLQDFQVCDMKFIGDKKTLIDYYISVSQAVRNLLKQTVSHTHKKITAQELLDLEKRVHLKRHEGVCFILTHFVYVNFFQSHK